MKLKSVVVLIGIILLAGGIFGCASVKVTRTDINKIVDLRGSWNDTDSRLVAEDLLKDCLRKPWADVFISKNNRLPVVIIGTVINRSSEHIDSQLFISDLEKNLLNSGRVKFVATKQERKEVREERADQQAGNASKETAKPSGQESGADFMLKGTINSVKDELKDQYVMLYQVNLELIDLATNEKAWIGQMEIKKIIKKSPIGL